MNRARRSPGAVSTSRVAEPIEFCVRGGTVVTCDPSNRVFKGDVLVRNGLIAGLGRVRPRQGMRVVDARDRIVLPGLVMAHVHLCQTLMRGMADDMPLLHWLRRRIWPLEAAHDDASLIASAELGLSELLLSGTTSILDLGTSHGHDAVFEACARAGLRVVGGPSLMDRGQGVPRRLRRSTVDNLRSAESLEQSWNRHPSGKIRYAWLPRFILSCSEALVRGALERAKSSGSVFHTHAAEHKTEQSNVRRLFGADDVELFDRWGARGKRVSFAHGVQLTPEQIRRLGQHGTGLVTCPSANLKLGSGILPLSAVRQAGVTVGLGADGAACNNNLDPWLEMRHAALLASARSGPGKINAQCVLRMATIDGARVLGLDSQVGSLELGKSADLLVVKSDGPHALPALDPLGTLVYATRASDVEHVFIAGEQLVSAGELSCFDVPRLAAVARTQAMRLKKRAGI